jgi:hypothetical protein
LEDEVCLDRHVRTWKHCERARAREHPTGNRVTFVIDVYSPNDLAAKSAMFGGTAIFQSTAKETLAIGPIRGDFYLLRSRWAAALTSISKTHLEVSCRAASFE